MCALLLCTGMVSAHEIMVGSAYGNKTISAALSNATDGDTIIVTDGTYTENPNVYIGNLTIRSQNGAASTAVVATASNDHVFYVWADNVTIN
nr:hypothetical protein [uncultured Methanolobus sp.]